jgi:uncharacterized membrane protein YeaQ/YmgE (transglycosylase-associated protein family)
MGLASLASWMLWGAILTLFVRRLFPSRQSMGLAKTMVLGIAGAVVSGFLFSLIRGAAAEPFSVYGNAWQGWLAAVIGAIVVLCAHSSGVPQELIAVISRVRRARTQRDND